MYYSAGLGLGFTAGNGLHFGVGRNRDDIQFGAGFLFDGEEGEQLYSLGARYLRTLYFGSVNDTYAWAGAGAHGIKTPSRGTRISYVGAGLGVSLLLGDPFRFNVDTGLHTEFRTGRSYMPNLSPSGNLALQYVW